MRPQTQKRIDALHAEIASLVQMEKDYMQRKQPLDSGLSRQVREAGIDVRAWPPRMREQSRYATATFPPAPKDQT